MTGPTPPWEGVSHVWEDAIVDRRQYEEACLDYLKRFPDLDGRWQVAGFELREANLEGRFPDTELAVVIWVPMWNEEYSESWPIWRGENEATISHGRPQRYSPSMLVQQYLMFPYFENIVGFDEGGKQR